MKKLLLLAVVAATLTGSFFAFSGNPEKRVPEKGITHRSSVNSDTLFYPTPDSLATTYDNAGKVDAVTRQKIFNLYIHHQWMELENLFNTLSLNGGWPPANGGYNTSTVTIRKGQVFDRYQSYYNPSVNTGGYPQLTGSFFSPVIDGKSFPYGMRALRNPENTAALYYKVEVLKDLTFGGLSATVIPWFGQPGQGLQTSWNIPSGQNLTNLAINGDIRITIVSSPNGQYTNLAGTTIPKQ